MDPLITGVSDTLAQAGGRFPVTADPHTGDWQWSRDGSWTGGFWAGLLRLACWRTGEQRYRDAADIATAALSGRASAPTLLRGSLFWYGDGLAHRWAKRGLRRRTPCGTGTRGELGRDRGVIPPG